MFGRGTLELTGGTTVRNASARLSPPAGAELYINGTAVHGTSVGDEILFDGFESLLHPGANSVAICVRRVTSPPGMLLVLRVTQEDGPAIFLRSDGDWRVSPDPEEGWHSPDADESGWEPARVLAQYGDPPWGRVPSPRRPCAYLRRSFHLDGPVLRARLYATALGVYEPYVNGLAAGEDRFAPGWTEYTRRLQYQTYDVTALLAPGENVVGVILGDGWYAGSVGWFGTEIYGPAPAALVQLEVEFADGSTIRIASDASWRCLEGPILTSDIVMGETYDARRERPEWCRPGLSEADLDLVEETEPNEVTLVAQVDPPVRVMHELHPIAITRMLPDSHIVDMGQNMAGWVRITLQGEAGTSVSLRHGEILNQDGTLYTANLRKAQQRDEYILAGGVETFEPRFTYHGFRYVEVSGYAGPLSAEDVTALVAYSSMAESGSFQCSNPMLNDLHRCIVWTQRANFLSVPTDCPQRDERLGWMGDAQMFAPTASFTMDMETFFRKWIDDILDAQQPDGAFTDVSPHVGTVDIGSPAWADAGVIVPWNVYLWYADRELLERCYPAAVRWIEYLRGTSDRLIRHDTPYADWLNVRAVTPPAVVATAYFAYSTAVVSRMARALAHTEDADRLEALCEEIAAAFRRAFVDVEGVISGDTQTAYVLALRLGLLLPDRRRKALLRLVADIESRDMHLSTGIVGTRWLLQVLADGGHADVAYRLLQNCDYPSWGYFLQRGATTIWERWDAWLRGWGLQNPRMNSFNHYALGTVGEFLHEYVAGLAPDPAAPGFRHAIIHPRIGGGLTWAEASYQSIYGEISVRWERAGGVFRLDVTVPPNARAGVVLPAGAIDAITESGRPVGEIGEIR